MAQTKHRSLVVLLALAAATGLATAQDKPPRPTGFKFTPSEKIPIPVETRPGRILRISHEDAMRIGARQNIDLSARQLVPLQALEDLRQAKALFEPELFGNIGARSTEDPGQNTFQPSLERDLYDGEVGWRQRVATGGLFDLAFSLASLQQNVQSAANFPSKQITGGWNVSYSQPLLRGAWTDYTLREIHSAEANLAGARATFQQDRQDTLLEIARAYWELVFARGDYRVQYQALELAQEQLRITNERIRVRALAERDRVADEAEVAERKERLILAQTEIHDRADVLRRLLFDDRDGRMWTVGLEPISPIQTDYDVSKLTWQGPRREARRHRPELKTLRNQVRIAEIEFLAANRDLLPQLDLVGSYNSTGIRQHSGDAWSDAFDVDFPDWSLRLQFSIPIGNSAAKARRNRARLLWEQERRGLFAQELQVDLEVRDAVRALKTAAESVAASRESVRLAASNLDTARHKLRVGELTFFDVQERNQELQEARSRLLRNQVDFRIAEAVLRHAQGKLEVPPPAKAEPDQAGPRRK